VKIEIPKLLLKLREEVVEVKREAGFGRHGALRIPAFRLDRDASEDLFAPRKPGIDLLSVGAAYRSAEEMGQPAHSCLSRRNKAFISGGPTEKAGKMTARDQILGEFEKL
jgi:hypothetical protein